MPSLTLPQAIAELEAICDVATPGPWHENGPFEQSYDDHGWRSIAGSKFVHVHREIARPYPQVRVDAKFIATARTAMPELIATVRALVEAWPHDDGCATLGGMRYYTDTDTGLNMMAPLDPGPCDCTRDAQIAEVMARARKGGENA